MAFIASAAVHSNAGYATRIDTEGHALTADEPTERGGTGTGPAPYDLLLSALGACSAITLRMYAERKGWELGSIDVSLRFVKTHDGREHIERDLRFGAPLSEEQRARLAEIVEKTPVTKTLRSGAEIRTRLL